MSIVAWSALESCPNVMNKYLENLGVPSEWRISDILSLDEEFLCLVPSPVLGVLLLFPFSEQDDEYCREQEVLAKSGAQEFDPDLYFMYQSIINGCGTVALIHALANNLDQLNMKHDALILKFIEATKSFSPNDKAKSLEHNKEIATALKASLERELGDKCDYHFVTLIHVNSKLFELDGRKSVPVFHGYTSEDSFLRDAVHICKEYIARDPNSLNFTALAFGAT